MLNLDADDRKALAQAAIIITAIGLSTLSIAAVAALAVRVFMFLSGV